ncbi:MAG: hypothetical protein K6A38_09720 [Lachnospiraceae bacterium]|nr:hypothetical protein [Lachnospiraceae bacterium]
MSSIKVITEKIKETKEYLLSRCIEAENLLQELSKVCNSFLLVIYAANLENLINETNDEIERSKESIKRLRKHTEKLEAIAGEYEITERRNIDEPDSINRG